MFKYDRMQKKVPSVSVWLQSACLDCMLLGVQVTAALGFLSASESLNCDSLL